MNIFIKLLSTSYCYRVLGRLVIPSATGAVVLLLLGLWGGLVMAPADYQQGDGFRIIYVHVPSAFLSMMVYSAMAFFAFLALVFRIKLANCALRASAPIGATFAFLALLTGSLWGKPMWGTWWIWDARLTSELILLFLYLGYMVLDNALRQSGRDSRASCMLVLVGVINIPIIHFSVIWWNTLHQGPSLSAFAKPAIVESMLWPLLVMLGAYICIYGLVLVIRMRMEILKMDMKSAWVKGIL